MAGKLDSPVQTQTAVNVLNKSGYGGNCHEEKVTEEVPVSFPAGRRRVFVQTDSGCVLGMVLDRRDNAHSVKRRLQLALNVPTDESSLMFGDMILNNDLSAVRKDCPLFLTRNTMHRSSSSPCLSPNGKAAQQIDKSDIIEILGQSSSSPEVRELVKETVKAIKNGVDPIPTNSGLGGVYHFRNCKGESVAIVKPTDEEPFAPNNPKGFLGKALGQSGLKQSVRIGETGYREVAAYLLDYGHFAKVPPTALVKISHSIFNINDSVNGSKLHNMGVVSKIASLQQFIPHDFDASDHGTSNFPVAAVHKIGILDVRIFNTDRHAGNLLVRKLDGAGRFGHVELIPIDHGLCLPEGLEDPYFEWIHWPQASIPFSEEEYEYIRSLDPLRDCEMLRTELPMIREACIRILVLCTTFLKEAAAFGLCLAEIGEMMSRECQSHEEDSSELEILCLEAKRIMAEREVVLVDPDQSEEQFQFDMDFEDSMTDLCSEWPEYSPQKSESCLEHKSANDLNPVLTLEQCVGQEQKEAYEEITGADYSRIEPNLNYLPSTVSKLSKSLKKINLVQKINREPKPAHRAGISGAQRRIAKESLPWRTGFVNLADLSEHEWLLFLDTFKKLLGPAFVNRQSSSIGQKLRQRLGTSCQF